jgi:hypothetical protein
MSSTRRFLLAPVILLALAATGPGARSQTPDGEAAEAAPELSRKLGAFVYIEEGRDLIFTVGVRAAAFHENDDYFPLEISLTNKQKGTVWVVTRESFTLFDEAGNEYEVPTQTELMKGYKKRHTDSRLFESRSVTATKLEGYRQVPSNFFPDPVTGINREPDTTSDLSGVPPASTSLVPIERVEVHSLFFLQDVLYFPHPEGRLIGPRFSLEFRAEGLEEPARIAFRIPKI